MKTDCTRIIPIGTNYVYKPSVSLKTTILNGCITLCILSLSSSTVPNAVALPRENVHSTSTVSTYPLNWARYNHGSINLFFEGDSSLNAELQRNYNKLDEIAALPDNWNNNQAPHFSTEIIAKMRMILSSLPIQPSVFPTARYSIQFEYEKQNGEYLEFELFEDGRLKKFSYSGDGQFSTELIEDKDVEGIVRAFYE